jgi:hypothetical protein
MHADLGIFGTEDGKVLAWDLKKPNLLDSFIFDKDTVADKITPNDKIRSINFTVDERFFVVSNKTQVAYYPTILLKEEKSSSAFKDLEIEYTNPESEKRKALNEITDTKPLNFFKDRTLNILGNIATTENKLVAICTKRDILSSIRDNF